MRKEDFERFEALEGAQWGRLAMEAIEERSIGIEESERRLRQMLNAED